MFFQPPFAILIYKQHTLTQILAFNLLNYKNEYYFNERNKKKKHAY